MMKKIIYSVFKFIIAAEYLLQPAQSMDKEDMPHKISICVINEEKEEQGHLNINFVGGNSDRASRRVHNLSIQLSGLLPGKKSEAYSLDIAGSVPLYTHGFSATLYMPKNQFRSSIYYLLEDNQTILVETFPRYVEIILKPEESWTPVSRTVEVFRRPLKLGEVIWDNVEIRPITKPACSIIPYDLSGKAFCEPLISQEQKVYKNAYNL
jgi:hypothetical protein